jgi:hypothetical protein
MSSRPTLSEIEQRLSKLSEMETILWIESQNDYDRKQMIAQIVSTQIKEQGKCDPYKLPPNISRLCRIMFAKEMLDIGEMTCQ